MNAFLLLGAIGFALAACFALSEGAAMVISHEFTAYANENLTLSCKPRDSPSHLVFWYKTDSNSKDSEKFLHTGPTFTIINASVTDTGIYSCSAVEWGTWSIKSYIMVNIIVPGEPSCADGWELQKTSCYMYSAPKVTKSWQAAKAYCEGSKAQLVNPKNSADILFLSNLGKNRSESTFWTKLQRGSYGDFLRRSGREAPRCSVFNKLKRQTLSFKDCSRALPFICERVLPTVPKDVSIEHITSSMARIGWYVAASTFSGSPQAYHVELTTSDVNVVSRISSEGSSVLFTHLQPNTRYQVRVQAENAAGNGSSSTFVAFKTKPRPPIIVSSAPNAKVIGGQSITLRCSHSHGNISWYKDGSDVPTAHGKILTIHSASPNDEGTYHCAVKNGLRGSLKVLVIVPPVITNIKSVLLKQQQSRDKNKMDLILLCETANRHPVEFAWMKNGTPLSIKAEMVKVSLQGNNTVPWQYECRVTNLAGTASRSIVLNPIGKTVDAKESDHPKNSTSPYLISAVAVVSVLLALFCFACITRKTIAKSTFKKKITRKLTAQSTSTEMSPVEFALSEHNDSPQAASRSPINVMQDHDDVFPYEVAHAWGGNGPYMSLGRREDNGEYEQDVTQVRKPDYFNISPSNRNDSAANCMYAPLKYIQGGSETKSHPYANIDGPGTCDM